MTKHFCDRCEKELKEEEKVDHASIGFDFLRIETSPYAVNWIKKDLCINCVKEFWTWYKEV